MGHHPHFHSPGDLHNFTAKKINPNIKWPTNIRKPTRSDAFMKTEILGRHYIIRGRVQGVFYRRFALKEAKTLHITGWVRNLEDGRVEVHAFGTAQQLLHFGHKLAQGPVTAKVSGIFTTEIPLETHDNFEVK